LIVIGQFLTFTASSIDHHQLIGGRDTRGVRGRNSNNFLLCLSKPIRSPPKPVSTPTTSISGPGLPTSM